MRTAISSASEMTPAALEGEMLAGLLHFPKFASAEEQAALLAALSQRKRRRLKPDTFGTYEVIAVREPEVLRAMRKKVMSLGLLQGAESPVQVNWYRPEKGIHDHIDNVRIRHGAVLSIGSSSVVHFRRTMDDGVCTRLLVQSGDLYILTGDAREAVHGITTTTIDRFQGMLYPRVGPRTAIIFGTLRDEPSAGDSSPVA